MLARGVALVRDADKLSLPHVEKSKVGLGSAQVTSQNHSNPPGILAATAHATGGRRIRSNRRRLVVRRSRRDNWGTAEPTRFPMLLEWGRPEPRLLRRCRRDRRAWRHRGCNR